MTSEPRQNRRGFRWVAFTTLGVALLLQPSVEAQDVDASGEPVADPPGRHPEAAKYDADESDAATDAVEAVLPGAGDPSTFMITGPGGVPVEAAPSDTAIETVRASLARINEQAAAGVPSAYVIQFGDTFDWLQLTSGEWIKGSAKRMRDDSIEFDSDELGLQTIDFSDVKELVSPTVHTYVFDDRVSATGLAVVTADEVIVETDEGTKTFPRSELESILEGGTRERDWWSMKLRFGLTLNRGNTDQLTYDILFNVIREDRMTLLDLSYNSSFGRSDGSQNVNRHLGEFDFKVFLSSRWFVVPAFGQLFNDRFQNIKFRATPAAGAGVHIIDKPKVKWDFQTGIGYQYLNYLDASQVTGSNPQNDVFIPLYTYADFDITGDVGFTVGWLTNLVVSTIGNTNHTGKADLSIELTSVIDLDISFLYLRTEDPAPPADPADPPIEQNDYQLIVGIALELG
ncbi:MAG: DUF481 domain-containing protein [Polyangiales bacterium]